MVERRRDALLGGLPFVMGAALVALALWDRGRPRWLAPGIGTILAALGAGLLALAVHEGGIAMAAAMPAGVVLAGGLLLVAFSASRTW